MSNCVIYNIEKLKIPYIGKNTIKYARTYKGLYISKTYQLDNLDMAYILIDILYSKGQINESTYRNIIRNKSYKHLSA